MPHLPTCVQGHPKPSGPGGACLHRFKPGPPFPAAGWTCPDLNPQTPSLRQVTFYTLERDGVDFVFVDHPSYQQWAGGPQLALQPLMYATSKQRFHNGAALCSPACKSPWSSVAGTASSLMLPALPQP